MLKVFLVEDEYVIRQAIRTTVDWAAGGFELVGEAGDGEQAYQMILAAAPDIVITDIRMPFMDGLELSALVQRKLPGTRIVILSGYDDFAYARRAISIGVTEYLLKPVSGAKLLETLKAVADRILSERQQVDYKAIYISERAERLRLEKQKFLRELIGGKLMMAEALEKAQSAGVSLDGPWYGILLVQLSAKEERNGREAVLQATDSILALAEEREWIGVYEQIGGAMCMLFSAKTREQLRERVQEEVVQARGITAGYDTLLFFASVGQSVSRISEIPHSFRDASRRFAKRFLYDTSRIFLPTGEESGEEGTREDAGFSLAGFDIGKMDRRLILAFLHSGAEEEVPGFVEECFSSIDIRSLDSQLLRHYVIMDAYLTCASFLSGAGFGQEEISASLGKLPDPGETGSAEAATAYYIRLFTAAIRERDRKEEDDHGSMIAEARQYLYRNYQRSDISLGAVAEAVGVSPNHLSKILSQKTGSTFVEQLTELRMEKARDLLLTTELPAAEIGVRVGYSDPHYFYYCFKKTQGMTPREYRQNGARLK